MKCETRPLILWWKKNRDTLFAFLALCVGSSLLMLSLSLHHNIYSVEVRVDLGESQHFSPACARETLVRLHGQQNTRPATEETRFGLHHTSTGVKLTPPAAEGNNPGVEISVELVPASTTDQLILSVSWEDDEQPVAGVKQFVSEEMTRDLDAIYDACVTPKTEPWTAHCSVSFGGAFLCPGPASTREATP
jgi:hypothetical protein